MRMPNPSVYSKIIIFFLFTAIGVKAQSFDYPALVEKIQKNIRVNNITDIPTMDNWITTQSEDGSWSDYVYGNVPVRGSNKHLRRLLHLTLACTTTSHAKYNDESYKKAIRKGLHFWEGSNNVDKNWWNNKIGWPHNLGQIMILMRAFPNYLSQGDFAITEEKLLSLFIPLEIKDITSHGVGANMLDIGTHFIYRGILTEDDALLNNASELLEQNLINNIKDDLSFQDHGPQLHISSYGSVYQKGVINIAYYLANTPAQFDITGNSFSTFLNFVKQTQIPSIRGKYWDYSVTGRGISRLNATRGGVYKLNILSNILDPDSKALYDATALRLRGEKPPHYNAPNFNKHYWVSDYTQHGRSNFLFTIRNVSERTVESETGNDENKKAHFLSFGANFIGVDGDEYFNIMPVWDWTKIPGVTARNTSFPRRRTWGVNFGKTDFVGGVSANNYGAVSLKMDHLGIHAKKGWFMFDDEIVCLGNSISSDFNNTQVSTTLNQCHGNKNIYYSNGQTAPIKAENSNTIHNPTDASWVLHDKVAYYFPNPQNVKFTLKDQSGSWKSINSGQPSADVTKEVFSLWIDHGNARSKEKYEYIIVPNISTTAAAKNHPINDIKIMANKPNVQAVHHAGLNIYQLIFYKADSITYKDFSLTVNAPCAVQIENDSLISIADPSQKATAITVDYSQKENSFTTTIYLPKDNLKGATVTHTISEFLPEPIESPKNNEKSVVYPNPSGNVFTLNLKEKYNKIDVKIFSADGKLTETTTYKDKQSITFNLKNQPAGIYFAHIQTEKEVLVKKLIKKGN